MLQSMRTYIYERRKGLTKTVAFVGGVYLVQRYVIDRLEELKVKLDQEKLAREA
jgi:peroxin-3